MQAHRVSSGAACFEVTGAVPLATGLAVSAGAGLGTGSGTAGAGLDPTAGTLNEPGAGIAAGALLEVG